MKPDTWIPPGLTQKAWRARERVKAGRGSQEDREFLRTYDELVEQKNRDKRAARDAEPKETRTVNGIALLPAPEERPPVIESTLPSIAPAPPEPPPAVAPPAETRYAEIPLTREQVASLAAQGVPIVEAEPMDEPSPSSGPPPPPPMPEQPPAPPTPEEVKQRVERAEAWAKLYVGTLKGLGARAAANGNPHIPDVLLDALVLPATRDTLLELGVTEVPPWAKKAVVVGAGVGQYACAQMKPKPGAPGVQPRVEERAPEAQRPAEADEEDVFE